MKICLVCRTKSKDTAKFCYNCGNSNFEQITSSKFDNETQKLSKFIRNQKGCCIQINDIRKQAFYIREDGNYSYTSEVKLPSISFVNNNEEWKMFFNKAFSWLEKFKKKNPQVIYQMYFGFYIGQCNILVRILHPFKKGFASISESYICEGVLPKDLFHYVKKLLPLADNIDYIKKSFGYSIDYKKRDLDDFRKTIPELKSAILALNKSIALIESKYEVKENDKG